jgi:ABC-type uncharacterized transport system permease subunit
MKMILREKQSTARNFGLIAIAVLITYAISAGLIRWAGGNPFAAFRLMLISPLQSTFGIGEVVLSATPILFTGIAVALAFRAGYWNIGAEGQFLMGAVFATLIALNLGDLPGFVIIPVIMVSAAIGGALWGVVPAILRVRYGIDEVVTTLLLNPCAALLVSGLLNGPWRNPETAFPETLRFPEQTDLPIMIPGTRIHIGFGIGLIVLVICWFVVARTATGLRLRAVGSNLKAAEASGVDVKRVLFGAALSSAAIAGLAGGLEVTGVQHQLTDGISPGFGYTGVIIATLAGLTFPGVLAVALLFADLTVGSFTASRVLQIPSSVGDVVQALLLVSVVALLVFRRYKIVLSREAKE